MEENKIHPLVSEASEQLRTGNMSRRDFLKFSTLIGMSLTAANFLASCAAPTPTPTEAPAATPLPAIKRGGTLTCATRVERVDNPATFSLVSAAHGWRHVIEYLTHTDPQGITHPYLLESWKASDDLKTWTLNIRKGVKFNNGKELNADDVMFNFKQYVGEQEAVRRRELRKAKQISA
jgi:peptide/nickel transport system substrate-binding protein